MAERRNGKEKVGNLSPSPSLSSVSLALSPSLAKNELRFLASSFFRLLLSRLSLSLSLSFHVRSGCQHLSLLYPLLTSAVPRGQRRRISG